MINIFRFVREYLFNGIFGFILYGLYATFLSPILTNYIELNEQSRFIAFFGFFMLVAEPFALTFKLKNARIRSEQKRKAYFEKTGIDVIPETGKLITYGFFIRLILRLTVVMVCISSLGYELEGKNADFPAIVIMLIILFTDICVLGYIYVRTDFFRDHYFTAKGLKIEKEQREKWNKIFLPLYYTPKYYWLEVLSDLVLQVYAIMLFTAFYDYSIRIGISNIDSKISIGYAPWDAALDQIPMLLALALFGLMPIRIAYWIEDSLLAFTAREKLGMWLLFALVLAFTFVPGITEYYARYEIESERVKSFLRSPYMNLLSATMLVSLIVTIRIILFKRLSNQP